MERAAALFKKATFVMERGYDDNKMFLKLDSMGQDYVIRLTAKRKLLYHNKCVFATELRNRRKGKEQGDQIQRRRDKGCKALLFQMEDRRIFPLQKADVIIQKADPIKEKVYFCYCQLAKGICGILSYAKQGVRLWFRIKRPSYRQRLLKLTI